MIKIDKETQEAFAVTLCIDTLQNTIDRLKDLAYSDVPESVARKIHEARITATDALKTAHKWSDENVELEY